MELVDDCFLRPPLHPLLKDLKVLSELRKQAPGGRHEGECPLDPPDVSDEVFYTGDCVARLPEEFFLKPLPDPHYDAGKEVRVNAEDCGELNIKWGNEG